MDLELIRTLYAYNEWANPRSLAAAAQLTPEQFQKDLGSSYPSVQLTLRHIMDIETLWLSRWGVLEFPGWTAPEDVPDVAALTAHWQPTAARLRSFIAGLAPSDLQRTVAYTDTHGTPYQHPLWVQLVNLANHGTHHRGQVTTLLRQLGATPPQNDIVYFHAETNRPA